MTDDDKKLVKEAIAQALKTYYDSVTLAGDAGKMMTMKRVEAAIDKVLAMG